MGKHTSGPWVIGADRGYGSLNGTQIRDARTGLVVAVAIGDVPELDSEANARLIAAAPDLLAALKALAPLIYSLQNDPSLDTATQEIRAHLAEITRAAIARATGTEG